MMNNPVELILSRLTDAKRTGDGWLARCPAHDDRTASLSVGMGDDGKVLLHCHAGCAVEAICAAIELQLRDLMPATNGQAKMPRQGGRKSKAYIMVEGAAKSLMRQMGGKRPDARWTYRDASGQVVGYVARWNDNKGGKTLRPISRHPDGWRIAGMPTPRPLYQLPELAGAQRVYLVEGEKAADAARSLGLVATTSAHGADSYRQADWTPLAGIEVIGAPDNDDPGERYVEGVADILTRLSPPAIVRLLRLPDLPEGGDMHDFVEMRQAAGASLDDIRSEIEAILLDAPVWRPESNPSNPSMATTAAWPEIERFEAADLPAFPTAALPCALRAWVAAESHATQTPPDMAALLAMAVCSAGIARRVTIEARPGFVEPTNLYVAVLLESGNRKSTVFNDAVEPLRLLEAELVEAARPDIARRQSERRQAEAKLKRLERQAADSGNSAACYEACELAADLAETPEPALPRLIVDDATAEKLGMMLAEQGGRIASMSPEGGVFDLMAGIYSKIGMPQFGVYLMGHAGDDLVTDRIGRKSVRVERPALTCAYAIQPQVISGLAEHAAFRGRGLLARFLYALPRSLIGSRQIATPPVPMPIREAYQHVVRTLAADNAEHVLRVDHGADERFRAWEAEVEGMLADGGDLETIRDWGGKLAGATLRLAAVLHFVEHGPLGRIGQPTVEAAIAIARYLIPHAETVLTMMAAGRQETTDAEYVLRWIIRHNKTSFNKSEAQQHGKRRFPKANDINLALAELEKRNYIRLRPADPAGPGRPASPCYDVHPALFGETSENRPENSENPTPDASDGNSQDIESALEEFDFDLGDVGEGEWSA